MFNASVDGVVRKRSAQKNAMNPMSARNPPTSPLEPKADGPAKASMTMDRTNWSEPILSSDDLAISSDEVGQESESERPEWREFQPLPERSSHGTGRPESAKSCRADKIARFFRVMFGSTTETIGHRVLRISVSIVACGLAVALLRTALNWQNSSQVFASANRPIPDAPKNTPDMQAQSQPDSLTAAGPETVVPTQLVVSVPAESVTPPPKQSVAADVVESATSTPKQPVTSVAAEPVTPVSKQPATSAPKQPVSSMPIESVASVSKRPVETASTEPIKSAPKQPRTSVSAEPVTPATATERVKATKSQLEDELDRLMETSTERVKPTEKQQKRPEQLERLHDVPTKEGLQKARDFREMGTKNFDAQNYQEAVRQFSFAVLLDNSESSYDHRALANFYARNYQDAIDDCTEVIERNRRHSAAYYLRGICNYRIGKTASGDADVHRAIELDPTIAERRKHWASRAR